MDLETGAVVGVTVQDADEGDTTTSRATLIEAAEQIETVLPDGGGLKEVVGAKGYHSNASLSISRLWASAVTSRNQTVAAEIGRRIPRRARRSIVNAAAFGANAARLLRLRGERLERPFAHLYETGGMRRVFLRGHTNIRKRLLIHVGGFNLGLLMRQLIGVGTPRGLQGRPSAALGALLMLIRGFWRLDASLAARLGIVSPRACLDRTIPTCPRQAERTVLVTGC